MAAATVTKRKSGRSLTTEERRELGQLKLQVWLHVDALAKLAELAKLHGHSRTNEIEAAVTERYERMARKRKAK